MRQFFTILGNLFSTPSLIYILWKNLRAQKRFLKHSIEPILTPYKNKDNSLTEKDFKKLINHYGLGIGGFLSTLFCLLIGKDLSEKERWAITAQGAITGLFDDLTDNTANLADDIQSLFSLKEEKAQLTARESLIIKFHDIIYQNAAFPKNTEVLENHIFELQIASRAQLKPDVSIQELKQIILAKGGTAVLYFRSALSTPYTEKERQLYYLLGQTSQIGSDIFDLYKDKQEGVHTLMTKTTDVTEMYYLFGTLLSKTLRLAHQTGYPQKNIKRFNRAVSFFMNRTFVCLKSYLELQKSNNNLLVPENHSRQELVCDMEKPKNLFLSFYYYLKTSI